MSYTPLPITSISTVSVLASWISQAASESFLWQTGGHGGWVGNFTLGASWCDPYKTWQKVRPLSGLTVLFFCISSIPCHQIYSFDPYANITAEQEHLVVGGSSLPSSTSACCLGLPTVFLQQTNLCMHAPPPPLILQVTLSSGLNKRTLDPWTPTSGLEQRQRKSAHTGGHIPLQKGFFLSHAHRISPRAEVFWTGAATANGVLRDVDEALPRLHDWRYARFPTRHTWLLHVLTPGWWKVPCGRPRARRCRAPARVVCAASRSV